MQTYTPFDIPVGLSAASYLAEVTSVQDPENLSRVQVRLLSFDGLGEQDAPLWARVAVPFAGGNRGAFMLPDVGDEVLITFINGDARLAVVVGGLWNGNAAPPETLGGAGDRIDRWTIVGKAGTRIAIVEEGPGESTISFTTPGGVSGEMTDSGGGKIEFKAAGTTITVDSGGVSVQTPSKVKVQASQVEVTAGMVKVDAAMSQFSGIVKCDVLQATTVISTTYTPGAGNVW
ncbi:MAG TPA: phage baseplate assembly protein V [Blastocatellia bacterium]|jgi:uncharacterized protein involved in type VI secretion and phage assembly|nr:phage baseplate assembly protein V [Blastocatellia bacterium]